jgi:tetratricopeptide (TPR) repeat protein
MQTLGRAVGAFVVACLAVGARAGGDAKPAGAALVAARVPRSYVNVSLRIPGYRYDAESTLMEREQIGEKILFAGHAFEGDTIVSLIVENDKPHAAGAQWRSKYCPADAKPFDVGGVACGDSSGDRGGIWQTNFNAYPVAAGCVFDLHVSEVAEKQGAGTLTQERFSEIVKSFRVAMMRRGDFGDYSEDCLALMDAAARRAPDHAAFLAAEAKARPTDPLPPFVLGEMQRSFRASDAECVAPYAQAIAVLDKKKVAATKDETFVRALAEEGLGLSIAGSAKIADALPHFQRAFDAAQRIASPVRAGLAFNLACALAKKGDAAKALDAVLTPLRALPAFQMMTAAPPAAAADVAAAFVPGTSVRCSLKVPDFWDLSEQIPMFEETFKDKVVLVGAPGHTEARVWVMVAPDEPHATSAKWRESWKIADGKQFDVGDVACLALDNASFVAFPVAAGFSFRVMFGASKRSGAAATKQAFTEMVQSFRASFIAAGTPADYPPEALEFMHGVATRMPTAWREWAANEATARPDDWVPPFVTGEAMLFTRAPAADAVAPWTQAAALLDKKKDATRGGVFLRLLAEDGLGKALFATNSPDAAVHLQKAADDAKALASPVRGPTTYLLARALAKQGAGPKALDALRQALETAPSLRDAAATEADFAPLKDDAKFKALVAK